MSTFRITTNGMFRTYRTNLTKNSKNLNDTMTDVQTQRKFNTYAEDPAAASKAWRLRRSYWSVGNQIDNNNYILSKYESATGALHAIVDGDSEHPGLDGILASIEGVSDTSGAARVALGRELVSTSESIVSMLNSKYGDDYIFAGADGANIPFEWKGDQLYYRGIDVSTPEAKVMSDFGVDEDMLHMPQPLTEEEFDARRDPADAAYDASFTGYADYAAYQADYEERSGLKFAQAQADYKKVQEFNQYKTDYEAANPGYKYEDAAALRNMADEKTYLDIGLGMQEDKNGKLVTGSAFNSAVSGLKFAGYGVDKNLAVVVRELGNIFLAADPETGDYASAKDKERASELLDHIHNAVRSAQGQHVQLEADAKYLQTNIKQLDTVKAQLNEQIMDTESMDPAEAITEMTWAQYCYNAALRIGTNLLSQSLIDYMS